MARTAHSAYAMLDRTTKLSLLAWNSTNCSLCLCTGFISSTGADFVTSSCTRHFHHSSSSSSPSSCSGSSAFHSTCYSSSSCSRINAVLPALLARHPIPTGTDPGSTSNSDPCSSPGSCNSSSPYSYYYICSRCFWHHPTTFTRMAVSHWLDRLAWTARMAWTEFFNDAFSLAATHIWTPGESSAKSVLFSC